MVVFAGAEVARSDADIRADGAPVRALALTAREDLEIAAATRLVLRAAR